MTQKSEFRMGEAATISGEFDIESFKVEESGKLFDIVISRIYTRKIEAVVREIGCNAYDAHAMVKTSKTPLITIPTILDPVFRVRDFGPGLDEDQMSMYVTLTKSTKETDNTQTGCYGLGSKSPFAYSNTFEVQSIKNGIKRKYSMFTDGASAPKKALIFTEPTQEPDGVEVSVPVAEKDIAEFERVIKKVFRFMPTKPEFVPSIEIDPVFYKKSEKDTVFSCDEFICYYNNESLSYARRANLLEKSAIMGNVSYDLDLSNDQIQIPEMFKTFKGFHLFIPNGMIDIPPSRENIEYSDRTKENLNAFLKKCEESYKKHLLSIINKDTPLNEIVRVLSEVERYSIDISDYQLFDFLSEKDDTGELKYQLNVCKYYTDTPGKVQYVSMGPGFKPIAQALDTMINSATCSVTIHDTNRGSAIIEEILKKTSAKGNIQSVFYTIQIRHTKTNSLVHGKEYISKYEEILKFIHSQKSRIYKKVKMVSEIGTAPVSAKTNIRFWDVEEKKIDYYDKSMNEIRDDTSVKYINILVSSEYVSFRKIISARNYNNSINLVELFEIFKEKKVDLDGYVFLTNTSKIYERLERNPNTITLMEFIKSQFSMSDFNPQYEHVDDIINMVCDKLIGSVTEDLQDELNSSNFQSELAKFVRNISNPGKFSDLFIQGLHDQNMVNMIKTVRNLRIEAETRKSRANLLVNQWVRDLNFTSDSEYYRNISSVFDFTINDEILSLCVIASRARIEDTYSSKFIISRMLMLFNEQYSKDIEVANQKNNKNETLDVSTDIQINNDKIIVDSVDANETE